ncbi:MAG: prephenate dehydrogenase/arogenate dehydrogenase family protein [Thaumarchaeota archaeon]|nr:prephenate dehydrogenase/arogenate dehydrogenase family protein [Nitrososphaerota archaeon]
MEKNKQRTLIVGAGGMGRWMAKWMVRHLQSDYDVWITDINKKAANKMGKPLSEKFVKNPLYNNYEMVISAVNLSSAVDLIRKLKAVKYAGTVIDMSSIKQKVNAEMVDLVANSVSVHPLFGPGARRLEGKTVLLVPVKDREIEAKISSSIFPGAKIVEIAEVAHDDLVTHTIQLAQLLSIISNRLMVHDRDLMGTSSRMMQYVEAASLYSSSRLIGEILNANPMSARLVTEIREVLDELEHGSIKINETYYMKELYDRLYDAMDKGCI